MSATAEAASSAVEASIGLVGRRIRKPTASRPGPSLREGYCGGLAEVAHQHQGPPNRGRGNAGGPGDRLHHHALAGPLAQLAHEQPPHEVGLRGRGPGQEAAEEVEAPLGRSLAGRAGDRVEHAVEIGHRQRRLRSRCGSQRSHRGPAHADASLAGIAGDEPGHDAGFAAVRAAQQLGQGLDLGGARRRGGHFVGAGDEIGEEHPAGF